MSWLGLETENPCNEMTGKDNQLKIEAHSQFGLVSKLPLMGFIKLSIYLLVFEVHYLRKPGAPGCTVGLLLSYVLSMAFGGTL